MKALLGGFFALACVVALAGAVSADPGRTDLPEGGVIVPPGEGDPRVPCDMLIRYDDGTDDSPGSGPTLADFGGGCRSVPRRDFLGAGGRRVPGAERELVL